MIYYNKVGVRVFKGNYNFFEYKYNIVGYNGQDYGGLAQHLYLAISIILLIILLVLFRKASREKVLKFIRIISIFLIIFYITKTTWESFYDIKYDGMFNTGLLPLDACSIIMLATLLSEFTNGKIKEYSDAWLATGGIVGGFATMLYLNAFKYYPFFSFGAFYSMIWHFLMVFIGLLLIITNYVEINYKTVIKGFLFHLIISVFIIPIDFIFNFDFMMYKSLGGIPIFEDIALNFTENGLQVLNPIMMLLLYFLSFNIIFFIPLVIKKIKCMKKLYN